MKWKQIAGGHAGCLAELPQEVGMKKKKKGKKGGKKDEKKDK